MDNNNQPPAFETKKEKAPLLQRMKDSGCFSPFYSTLMILFAVSIVIYILSRFITPLAEFLARYPSHGIRYILALLTSWIPFSLAECIVILLPLMFVAYMVYATRFIKSDAPGFGKKVLMPLI